jgi:alkylresorcinol/alkylpyrone synthase
LSRVKLVSIGYAVPELFYTQEQAFYLMGYPKLWKQIFCNSGIDKRHFAVPLTTAVRLSFQEQQELYLTKAVELSSQAIMNCLDGRDPKQIKCVVFVSCTGIAPGPTVPHYFTSKLGFSQGVYITNISGQGCEGAFPGLKRAYDYVKANGGQALVVNCELCSLAYWPEKENPDDVTTEPDPENDYEVLRAMAIFSDGSCAALIGGDDNDWRHPEILWRHPEILDTETYTESQYADDLGFIWRNGRLRIRLSRRVKDLAPLVVKPAVGAVLLRQGLRVQDIAWWVIHAAGSAVIDNIGKALGLPEEKLKLSRETLRLYGNTSSTSVGIQGKRLMSENIQPGDYIMMISVGPGMTGGATCMRFGMNPRPAVVYSENKEKIYPKTIDSLVTSVV